ncbi:MAG: EAL domain-containing protein, partial [Gammaproteobacteria bacterium]
MIILNRLLFIETVRGITQKDTWGFTLLYTEINHTLQIASLLQGTAAEEHLRRQIQTMIYEKVNDLPDACMGILDKNRMGILLKLSVTESLLFAEDLANLLDEQCINFEKISYYPKLIIGVTELSPEYKTPERIFAAVDEALYQAKRAGNSVVKLIRHDDPFLHEYYDLLKLLPDLREGLSKQSFVLYAQPIVPIGTADAEPKAEVLLRYKNGDGDINPQRRLLQAADLFHIGREIDLYVVRNCARYISQRQRQDIVFSLNISGSTIRYPGFIDIVLKEFSVNPEKVCFEITETVADQDYRHAIAFMQKLKKRLGCQLSLDDIGIGSSNLANLSKFDVDYFKIDGSFIHNLLDDPYSEL